MEGERQNRKRKMGRERLGKEREREGIEQQMGEEEGSLKGKGEGKKGKSRQSYQPWRAH